MKAPHYTPPFLTGLLILICAASFLAGTGDKQSSRIRQTINLKNGHITDYTYAADGRISRIATQKGSFVQYAYKGKTIVKTLVDSLTGSSIVDTITLDDHGMAIEVHNGPEAAYGISRTLTYDAAGYLQRSRVLDKGVIMVDDVSLYKDGDRISLSQSGKEAKKPNMLYYTYYPAQLNTISDDNMGMEFMGHGSRLALKEMTAVSPEGDTTRTSYHYRSDDKGRISLKTSWHRSALVDSIAYIYY